MGKGYKHGGSGGAALNFNVKTYPSETELKADKPRENTIGVITTTTMTSWVFSATEPKEPKVGMVWFKLGTSSAVEFNALKNNTLQVYPLTAKQYVGDTFVEITAMSYQVGEWGVWSKYLFDYGSQSYVWQTRGWAYNSSGLAKAPTITENTDGSVSLSLTAGAGSYPGGAYELAEDVDLTSIKKLELYGEYSGTFASVNDCNVYLIAINRSTQYWGGNAAAQAYAYWNSEFPLVLDVSSLTGKYDIAVVLYSSGKAGTHTFKFEQLKMLE